MLNALPEAVALEATDSGLSSRRGFLVALLVFVNELEVGLHGDISPTISLQFSAKGEFSHVVDSLIDFGGHGGVKKELGALLGSEREGGVNGRRGEAKWLSVDRKVWAHSTKDAWVRSSLILYILGMGESAFVGGWDEEGVVVRGVIGVQPEPREDDFGWWWRWRRGDVNGGRRGNRGNGRGTRGCEPRMSDRKDVEVARGWRRGRSGRLRAVVWTVVAGARSDVGARGGGEDW
jgi:hypothetical protein